MIAKVDMKFKEIILLFRLFGVISTFIAVYKHFMRLISIS
jgi:hypothetical protein